MECPKEFDDIRPFYDSEFHDKMKVLVTEPGFRARCSLRTPRH